MTIRCPEAIRKAYGDVDTCALDGRVCLLESGTECSTYNEYLETEQTK